jgi:pantetheine-phosphate adenylyltransferase
MTKAIFPGSFDPVTFGHLDILQRALKLFDHVVVAILVNDNKTPLFSQGERMALMQLASETVLNPPSYSRIQVVAFRGLLVDVARKHNATAIVRGLRAVSDFEYETQVAMMNRELAPELETTFLMTQANFSFVSSRLVKEVVRLGGDLRRLVPPCVIDALHQKFQ